MNPSQAAIIAVGSELLTPARIDTNSLFTTARLNELGIDVRFKTIVGDDREALASVLRDLLARVDLVVLTGGLGPTADDVTRDVVSGVLDRELVEQAWIVERIQSRFSRRGMLMPEINRRQALVPRGAEVLDNPNGTAPGLWLPGPPDVLLLPGPPRELQPMLVRFLEERIAPAAGGHRLWRRVLHVTGLSESHIEEIAEPIYTPLRNAEPPIVTTILAAPGQIELHLACRSREEAAARTVLDAAVQRLSAALHPSVYSTDGRMLEHVVGDLLRARGLRVAVAESCTGGLITSRLTDVPGSSAYVEAAGVVYSNAAKTDMLGVPGAMLAEHGAVSEPVAQAMAEGARRRFGTEVGVAVTGIAGPGGGSAEKPVGMVVIAVSIEGRTTRACTRRLPGDRAQVKYQASQAALDMLRLALLDPDF